MADGYGTPDNPVQLDPFQTIIDVHWDQADNPSTDRVWFVRYRAAPLTAAEISVSAEPGDPNYGDVEALNAQAAARSDYQAYGDFSLQYSDGGNPSVGGFKSMWWFTRTTESGGLVHYQDKLSYFVVTWVDNTPGYQPPPIGDPFYDTIIPWWHRYGLSESWDLSSDFYASNPDLGFDPKNWFLIISTGRYPEDINSI